MQHLKARRWGIADLEITMADLIERTDKQETTKPV